MDGSFRGKDYAILFLMGMAFALAAERFKAHSARMQSIEASLVRLDASRAIPVKPPPIKADPPIPPAREISNDPAATADPRRFPVPGEECVVFDAESGGAYIATDEAWDEFIAACEMEDEDAGGEIVDRLAAEGKVILEENGAVLEVLRGGLFTYRVRVVKGLNPGWTGWIPKIFTKPL